MRENSQARFPTDLEASGVNLCGCLMKALNRFGVMVSMYEEIRRKHNGTNSKRNR